MPVSPIFKAIRYPRTVLNRAVYVPKLKAKQLSSPRYSNVLKSLESSYKSPSARGSSASFKSIGRVSKLASAGLLKTLAVPLSLAIGSILLTPESVNEGEEAALKKARNKRRGTLKGLNPGTPTVISVPAPPRPFKGGQSFDVEYYIYAVHEDETFFNPATTRPLTGLGRIDGVVYDGAAVNIQRTGADGRIGYIQWGSGFKGKILEVRRVDGQPEEDVAPPPIEQFSTTTGISFNFQPAQSVSEQNPSVPPVFVRTPTPLLSPPKARPIPTVPTQPNPDEPTKAPIPIVVQPDPVPSPEPEVPKQTNPTSRVFWDYKPATITPATGQGPGPQTVVIPKPAQITPATGVKPLPTTPTPLVQDPTVVQISTDGTTRIPAILPPVPKTEPAQKTIEQQIQDQLKDTFEKAKLTGIILAGLTPIIQSIGQNTTQSALENAAAAGTCRTTQPGGCTSNALNDAVGRINDNTAQRTNALDVANGLANATQLGMLQDITNRVGDQVPGGISGKLSRFVNWSVADRVTGLVTMFASLHNTMMLSNSVKETFLDILDNLLNTGYNLVPNLFKKADEDAAIDSREYIGGAINTFFGRLFGVTEWTALQQQWKAYSTIYSSSTNAYDNLRSIHNDSQELLNRLRKDTGELGNALVDEGIISEDNWEYRDTEKRVKSKSLMRLERMNQGLEEFDNKLQALEQVTQLVLNITNTAKEIEENADEIGKAFKDADKAATLDRNAKVEGLEVPNFNLVDFLDAD